MTLSEWCPTRERRDQWPCRGGARHGGEVINGPVGVAPDTGEKWREVINGHVGVASDTGEKWREVINGPVGVAPDTGEK